MSATRGQRGPRPRASRKILARLLITAVVAGCAEPKPPPPTPVGFPTAPTPSGPTVRVTGTLADTTDRPLPDSLVLACTADYCLFYSTDAEGRFQFDIEAPVDVALKTLEDLQARPRRGAALAPLQLVPGIDVEVGQVHVPALPEPVPIAAGDAARSAYDAGADIVLELVPADLEPHAGETLHGVAAALIAPEHIPAVPGLGHETVLAVVAFHPFGATSRSPVTVAVPVRAPEGAEVQFRTISELDGHLSQPVAGTVGDGAAQTAAGTGIRELTWLVVSR